MQLRSLVLQHFRSYSQKKFDFAPEMTIIIGPNTAGKTNLIESVMLLATGKSFRAEKDVHMIAFSQDVARVQGLLEDNGEKTKLEITLAYGAATGGRFVKRFAVNDVPKSCNHFVGYLPAVLFRPEELEIIVDGPSIRREFLDSVLEQVDNEYRTAKLVYDKSLRQRNALLGVAREIGIRNAEQFSYWDNLLITNGQIITQKREALITTFNDMPKEVSSFTMHYDKSVISHDRLLQYKDAEIGAGVTLVGPQRDDVFFTIPTPIGAQNISEFGSRGQQRLVVLQLKLLQLVFVEGRIGTKPLLLLDDIFSELDNGHIDLVLEKVKGSQIILTTTHKEFVSYLAKKASMIELKK
jgi:DNA replication and repair protein RecF